ncbi:MAG TPA: hypothetical protein VFE98_09320 [Candidatus Bathyarchaeia archaeon]|nr:hypothetical protein [Candidatus Bathyarchaeia archaeon]
MSTLLEHVQQARERSSLPSSENSRVEEEILAMLQRSIEIPPALEEVRRELQHFFSELRIQNAIIHLLEHGDIQTVYMSSKLCLSLSVK